MTAKAEPPPPPPAPKPNAAPVVALAALTPETQPAPRPARADFDAPVPLAKPKLAAPVELAAFDAPVPRLKPALDADAIDGEARVAALEVLNRPLRPRLVAMAASHPAAVTAGFDVPVPQPKPDAVAGHDVVPQLIARPLVPDVAPGETPVPSAKPPGLRQTADAGGRT